MSGVDYIAVFKGLSSVLRQAGSDALMLPSWTEENWRRLLQHTELQRFRAGDMVIQRGAADRALYLVAGGALEIGASRPDGATAAAIARAGIGSVIGEQSFFDGEPRSTNVWAVSDGELLRLDHQAFGAFAQVEPALACDFLFAVARILSLRLRNTSYRVRR